MLKTWRLLSSIVAMSGGLALPGVVLADRATVMLNDGTELEGELTEYFPGEHVTLLMANAERQQIAAAEVASVKVHATEVAPPQAEPLNRSSESAAISVRGKLQLGLSAPLLRYSSLTQSKEGSKFERSSVQWGVPRAAAVELGYGVSDVFVIGAMAQVSGDNDSSDTLDTSAFSMFIGPKLDLQLETRSRFKPFFGALVGLNYSSNTYSPKGGSTSIASNSQMTTLRVLARAGVRWFAMDDISLDLSLSGGFDTGSYSLEASSSSSPSKSSFDVSGSFIGLNLGASVWPDIS